MAEFFLSGIMIRESVYGTAAMMTPLAEKIGKHITHKMFNS